MASPRTAPHPPFRAPIGPALAAFCVRCGAVALLAGAASAEGGGRLSERRLTSLREKADTVSCGGQWLGSGGPKLVVEGILPPAQVEEAFRVECGFTGSPPGVFHVLATVERTGGGAWASHVEVDDAFAPQQWTEPTFGTPLALAPIPYTSNPQAWTHTVLFDVGGSQTAGTYAFVVTETITPL